MTQRIKQYNYCLDFIKGIACIFVVWMHCEFPGLLGIAVQAISRFCVPLFFMVSGYFCFNVSVGVNSSKKIKHVAKIALYSSLFYLAFVGMQHIVFHNQDFEITTKRCFIWIIFNAPIIIESQYWFLFALLYTYVFFFFIRKHLSNQTLYYLAGSLFVLYYVLAQGAHLSGFHVPNYIYRNWLIEGFPFFMLGHFLHEYQDRIHIKNNILLIVIVISTILCLPERYLMGRDFGVNICTPPQVIALMLYAIKNPYRNKGVIQKLGKYCSMFVYILHPAVWHSMDGIYQINGISGNICALYLKPIVVVIITILLSFGCSYIQKKNKMAKAYA